MDRRGFFQNLLKASGSAAVLAALDTEKLFAMPPAPLTKSAPLAPLVITRADGGVSHVPAAWSWDGKLESLVERLDDLTQHKLARPLLHADRIRVVGDAQNDLIATVQFNAAFHVDDRFRCGDAGLGRIGFDMVQAGQLITPVYADPLASLDALAADFAAHLSERPEIVAYADLMVPKGGNFLYAAQHGIFRAVWDYNLIFDDVILRFDTMACIRRQPARPVLSADVLRDPVAKLTSKLAFDTVV